MHQWLCLLSILWLRFNVAPFVFFLCLSHFVLCIALCHFRFCNNIDEVEKAGCFISFVFLVLCDCYFSVSFPYGAVGLIARLYVGSQTVNKIFIYK